MIHKVEVEVTGSFTSVFVKIEGFEISLVDDGKKTYKGTREIDIVDDFLLVFQVKGFNGSDWSISVTLDDADKPIFKKPGTIEKDNSSFLKETIKII